MDLSSDVLGEGDKLTPFIFLWASTKIQVIYLYQSPFRHLCYSLLSLKAPEILGFLLKYLICCFSPTSSSVVNLRDFYLCINDIFDPFFLVLQPPLTWPLFSFNPFSNTKDHLSSELPSCQYRPVLSMLYLFQSLISTELLPGPQQDVP